MTTEKCAVTLFQFIQFFLAIPLLLFSTIFFDNFLSGCDFIQLHFQPPDINFTDHYYIGTSLGADFFKNAGDDPYIGLGAMKHQPIDNTTTSNSVGHNWINDSTCHSYDDFSRRMLMPNNGGFHWVVKLLCWSDCLQFVIIVCTYFYFISIVIHKYKSLDTASMSRMEIFARIIGPVQYNHIPHLPLRICQFCLWFCGVPLVVNGFVFFSILNYKEEICGDRETYFPDGWYETWHHSLGAEEEFSKHSISDFSYFEFFHECKLGKDGKNAINFIICQAVSFILSGLCLLLGTHSSLQHDNNTASASGQDPTRTKEPYGDIEADDGTTVSSEEG